MLDGDLQLTFDNSFGMFYAKYIFLKFSRVGKTAPFQCFALRAAEFCKDLSVTVVIFKIPHEK